jgi:hypothetical protein
LPRNAIASARLRQIPPHAQRQNPVGHPQWMGDRNARRPHLSERVEKRDRLENQHRDVNVVAAAVEGGVVGVVLVELRGVLGTMAAEVILRRGPSS